MGLRIFRADAPEDALLTSLDFLGIVVVSNVKLGVPSRCGTVADANALSMSSEKRTLGVSLSCVEGLCTAADDKAEDVADPPIDEKRPSPSSAIAKSVWCST